MRFLIPFAALLSLLLFLFGCQPYCQLKPEFVYRIKDANYELMERFNKGDKLAVARMYEDDALMISSDGERHQGREAIDRYWVGDPNRPRPATPPRWVLKILSLDGTPEMPIQRGQSQIHSEWQGKSTVSDVQFLVIWRRQPDNTYRITVDAWWPTKQ